MLADRARRPLILPVVAALLFFGAAGVVGCAAEEPAVPPATLEPSLEPGNGADVPEIDPARVLVKSKCAGCHSLESALAKTRSRLGWKWIMGRMKGYGLQVTDEERETILDFLASQ